MNYVEDVYNMLKFLVWLFLLPFPVAWHSRILPLFALCYLKGLLPINPSGNLELTSLNQMDWGMLPIEDLWPHIINPSSGVQEMLLGHCDDFKLDQILWIAKNDPANRAFLLKNSACMRKINWSGLETEDYRRLLPELEITDISNFDDVVEEVIIDGLIKADFFIPSTKGLCEFLDRLPLPVFYHPDLLSKPKVSKLFNVNCFIEYKEIIRPMTDLLFKQPQYFSYFQITELLDFLQTFPQKNPKLLPRIDLILHEKQYGVHPIEESKKSSNFLRFFTLLQQRNPQLLTMIDPGFLRVMYDLGPFDQYRILQTLLCSPNGSNLDTFISFFEEEIFEEWLLLKFLEDYPEIVNEVFYTSNITSLPLLRFLCLRTKPATRNMTLFPDKCPLLVPQAHEITTPEALKVSLRLLSPSRLAHGNFRIKFANDAVVDLGGPLQDWITEILQLYLQFGLFSTPDEGTHEAEAVLYLDPEFFKFLGMLHGKLVQIGSGPTWLPVITKDISTDVARLFDLKDDPAEAVRLFNDFEFPSIECPHHGVHKVKDLAGIAEYWVAARTEFTSWKNRALWEYQVGLNYFILESVPRSFVRSLLLPTELPTVAQMIAHSQIIPTEDDLFIIWKSILVSFTPFELLKLLIFITGQCRLKDLSIHFIQMSERRLPQSKTCFAQLFLYTPSFSSAETAAMTAHLAQSLKTSIYNYQGFGHI